MFIATWTEETGWQEGNLQPYGPLQLLPSAQALNYGQAIFEGMKAQRPAGSPGPPSSPASSAGGGNNGSNGSGASTSASSSSSRERIVLFRPDRNAARMAAGAERMAMPPVPSQLFVRAVERTVAANREFVPPAGKGSFYLRPLLMGTGPILGLGPAPSFTFVVFGAAVGAYFKGGQLTPIHLLVEEQFHRSAPRGMGGTKAAGNYSPVLPSQLAAKKLGYSDVIYLDAKHDRYLEEVSSCNVFCVKGRTIATPPLQGSILPGVTRASVIELARSRGYRVEERAVSVDEAMEADELFTTGTAVVVCSVGSLTYKGVRRAFNEAPDKAAGGKKKLRGDDEPGPVALEIYEALTGLQTEAQPDPFGWVHPVPL
jgi:branched-chain amino acid aminotransferase